MKGDRVPLEEQKKSKAAYQRRVREEKRRLGLPLHVPKLVPPEQKKINMEIKKKKHRAWLESDAGKNFLTRMAESKRKHASPKERNRHWSKICRERIHQDVEKALLDRLSGCKYRAMRDGIPFDMTFEDLKSVYTGRCAYLGLELIPSGNGRGADNSLSIDRIIPELGYTKGNVQIISYKANKMKVNATIEELLMFARSILALHGSRSKSPP